jgi:phospholipase D1/2
MNFVKRWDGIACEYENSRGRLLNRPLVKAALKAATKKDALGTLGSWLPKIKEAHKLQKPAASAAKKCTIQVLRSAPLALLKDECKARKEKAPALKQNNCLKAMVRAIRNSKQFLYIEGQFFQSDFGAEGPNRGGMSGPLGVLMDIKRSPGYRKFAKELQIEGVSPKNLLAKVRLAKVDDVMRDPDWPRFKKDLDDVLKNLATIQGMDQFGKPQKHLLNPLGQTLVCRFRKAILDDNLPYHVYMVLPVHPEGTLNTLNIISQTHLTMHSLSLGDDSLVNGLRRALMERRLFNARTPKPKGVAQVEQAQREIQAEVRKIDTETLAKRIGDEWREYLTLLNLRNWETIGGRPVTEMIYVHSKLLIADDQVAILGSANINDRSQLGERDSELAVIIHDSDQKSVALDGKKPSYVSACVHELRKSLWSKIFGLRDGAKRPASDLAGVLDKPMAPETWKKIQQVAIKNADAYEKAFLFTPRNQAPVAIQAPTDKEDKPPASIWPIWRYKQLENHNAGGRMAYRMPFEYSFWRKPDVRSDSNTWEAKTYAPERVPDGVQGFIVDLPVNWTMYENNNTGFNLAMIAMHDPLDLPGFNNQEPKTQMAAVEPAQPLETTS